MHRRISVYIMDRLASKSTPLHSHLVLNSWMHFRSISTASDVHDHFLGLFVADSGAKDAFLFPCDLFDFSPGKPSSISFRVERLFLVISPTFGSWSCRSFREMSTLLSSDCSELCSDNLATKERRKYSRAYIIPARSHYRVRGNLTVYRSDPTKVDPPRRASLPQVFTWQKVGPLRRVTLPSWQGDPTPGWPLSKPNRKIQ